MVFTHNNLFAKRLLSLYFGYVTTAYLSLLIQRTSGLGTQIWPAAALALTAILLWGPQVWSAIFLGTLTVHIMSGDPLYAFIGPAIGNTVEPLVGAYFLRRSGDFHLSLDRVEDLLRLLLFGAVLSPAVGTLIGVPYIWFTGYHVVDWNYWLQYWVGDASGILIVTPLLLVFNTPNQFERFSWKYLSIWELLSFAAALVGAIVLFTATDAPVRLYFFFPLVLWAAMRLGLRGATLVILVISFTTVWYSAFGVGPFGSRDVHPEMEFYLFLFVLALAITGLSVATVVSQREMERKNLRKSEEYTRAIVESAMDCIVSIDYRGRVIAFNPIAEKTFGYSSADAMGRELAELIIPPRYREAHRRGLAKYNVTGEQIVFNRRLEFGAIKRDGSEFPIELTVTHGLKDGHPIFIGFIRDITERKKSEKAIHDYRTSLENSVQELKIAKEAADAANQAKSAFLANMSHEIRTPLGVVLGFSELLLEPTISAEEKAKYFRSIKKSGQTLANIINDILDLSKVEAGKFHLSKSFVSLADLLAEMNDLFQASALEKQLTLVVTTEGAIPRTIETDPLRLRQILTNIIGNAIKFTDHASVFLTVKMVTEESGSKKLSFVVKDEGIGISPEQAKKLFVPFSQVDFTSTRQHGGTGLGLVLARKLARSLGGDVVLAESALGLGSTFIVTIDPGP